MKRIKLLALTTLTGLSLVAGCMVFMNTEPNGNRVSANVENPYSVTYTYESFEVKSTSESGDFKTTILTANGTTAGGSTLTFDMEIWSNSNNVGSLLNHTIYQSYGSGHLLRFNNLVLNNIEKPVSVELKGTLMKEGNEINSYTIDTSVSPNVFTDNGDGSWSFTNSYNIFGQGCLILQSIIVNYTCTY